MLYFFKSSPVKSTFDICGDECHFVYGIGEHFISNILFLKQQFRMGAVKPSALALCLTLCTVVSFSARVSGGNDKMCGAVVTADDGDDWVALRNKAMSALGKACRRPVQTTGKLQTVSPKTTTILQTLPPKITTKLQTVPPRTTTKLQTVPAKTTTKLQTVPPRTTTKLQTVPPKITTKLQTVPPRTTTILQTVANKSK